MSTPHRDPAVQAAILQMQKNLQAAGFNLDDEGGIRPRLILGIAGGEGVGKTCNAFSAPDGQRTFGKKLGAGGKELGIGMLYVGTDVGREGVYEPFKAAGKIIYPAEHHVELPFNPDHKQVMDLHQAAWERLGRSVDAAIASGARTVIVDTADEVYQWLTLARFGRSESIPQQMWGLVQGEYLRLMRRAYNSDCNLILLHKLKKQYLKSAGTQKADWNGNYDWKGFPDNNYLCQVMVKLGKTLPHTPPGPCLALGCDPGCTGEKRFWAVIEKCRHKTFLEGLKLPVMLNDPMDPGKGTNLFSMVAGMVIPEVDPQVWEG